MTDLVCKMSKIQSGLLQLELTYRLLLLDVTGIVTHCVAHGALSACYHFADGVLPQAICLALWIMGARKQRHPVVWSSMGVVTEQGQDARHRAGQLLTASTSEDSSESIAAA